jgi:hypothetical protein
MTDYTPIFLSRFRELEGEQDITKFVIKGIPRAVNFRFGANYKFGDDYRTSFYLHDGVNLVYVYSNSKDYYGTAKEQLLNAASESGLEITVKGSYESGEGSILKAPNLYLDEMIIDGRVCPNYMSGTKE